MNPTLYFVLALTAVLSTNAGPILDVDGDSIFSGSYYVLPATSVQGGGLTLESRGDKYCPLDIVQEESNADEGVPVNFSNWRSRVGFVPESENLNVGTDIETGCVHPSYWWIDEFDQERKKYFVIAAPAPDGFGEDTLNSFFQIKKHGESSYYTFVFCPQGGELGTPKCSYVGIAVDEEGVRRLALSDEPFLVVFKKAKNEEPIEFV